LPTNADAQTTSLVTVSHHTSGIDAQATGTSTSQDIIMGTELEIHEGRNATAESMASILTSVGAIGGAVILLSAIAIILILIMACLVWKRKNKDYICIHN
jgi:hypothetical protein